MQSTQWHYYLYRAILKKRRSEDFKAIRFSCPPGGRNKFRYVYKFRKTTHRQLLLAEGQKNPKVIDYLKAENAYTDSLMASTETLRQTIYNEIVGRIKEDDETYPSFSDGYYYYSRTEKGKQYRTYCRRKGTMEAPEEIIFDVNRMAEGKPAFIFAGYSISPDNSKAAYFSMKQVRMPSS